MSLIRMEKDPSKLQQVSKEQEPPVLPTLVSLDSLDIFGVPELAKQPETLESIYQNFVAPQRDAGIGVNEPAGPAAQKAQKKSPEAVTVIKPEKVVQLRQARSQANGLPSPRKKDERTSGGSAGVSSSPKRVPVWEQQPAWRQNSQETMPDRSPRSPTSQGDDSSVAKRRNAPAETLMARRPRESSLKMRERREAARVKESGSLSRAGSAAAAVHKGGQAISTDAAKDRTGQASGRHPLPIND